MINDLKVILPDLYLTSPIEAESLENIKEEDSNVIKRIFMIKNEVNPDYFFLDLDVSTGFTVSARIIPQYSFIGRAARQLKSKNLFKISSREPHYKIKVTLYKIVNYEKVWNFEYITKNKMEIYRNIEKIKKQINYEIETYGSKIRQ